MGGVDATNDYENRAQAAAVYQRISWIEWIRLVIKDNIFAGYQTVEKDDDHKKTAGKISLESLDELDFDGEDDFAAFLSQIWPLEKGTLAFG